MEQVEICGVVEPGRQLGRALGFPTANLALPAECQVLDGVYRSEVTIEGEAHCYCAMSNVGCNPSVGGAERRLESHLFDFEGELYGRRICVRLLERIREERHFDSLEALQAQLERDKKELLKL